jgi:two-component system response regulator AtoC
MVKQERSAAPSDPTVEPAPVDTPPEALPILEKVTKAKEQAETEAILSVLNATCWNRKQAAALLNIDYKALLYKMKKLNVEEKAAATPRRTH